MKRMFNPKGAKVHRLRTTVLGNEMLNHILSLNRLVSLLMDMWVSSWLLSTPQPQALK